MKWSDFNVAYKSDEGLFVLYNYARDEALVLEPGLHDILCERESDLEGLASIHPDFYTALCDKGFVIGDDVDEKADVKKNIIKELHSHDVFHLTVNPTLDCNLRCWYCYEKHVKDSRMCAETMSAVIKFVENLTDDDRLKTLELGFFGGEPLLSARRVAIPLLREIKSVCAQRGKVLSVTFTSNGVLLSESIADELASVCDDIRFQIAFDGGEETHDEVKFLSNGQGTYRSVLRNIDYAMSKGFAFNIRCNYNTENIDSFKGLVGDVASLPHLNKYLLFFSLQKVWQSASSPELADKVDALRKIISGKDIKADIAAKDISGFCYADYMNSLVINYDGGVYKCTARDFNETNRIGSLECDGTVKYDYDIERIYSESFFFKDCDSCLLLPICRICIQARVEHRKGLHCFKKITEEDKRMQIKRRFETLFGEKVWQR